MNDEAMRAAGSAPRVEIASAKVLEGNHHCRCRKNPVGSGRRRPAVEQPTALVKRQAGALSFKGVDTVTLGL